IGIDNLYGYTDDFTIDLEALTDGKEYRIDVTADGETRTVKFTAGADAAASRAALNTALSDAFKDMKVNPQASADGRISAEGKTVLVKTGSTIEGENAVELTRNMAYSKNYIQITLDAAKALRNGDIAYANGCIDKIVTATENLLVEIADLGCNEEYIEFTTGRFETRELNLKDRQKSLEATDLEKEITMMKTYEALYNAALQMASSVVPNSIFNYIK
ncbi:MAG: flagellin, partial [Oscillospiraceae bacterium]